MNHFLLTIAIALQLVTTANAPAINEPDTSSEISLISGNCLIRQIENPENKSLMQEDIKEPKWKFKTGGRITTSPAIADDGTIYVGSDDENLYALNPDGTMKWKYFTDEKITTSPVVGIDGTIYFGSNTYLFALTTDGEIIWKKSDYGRIFSTPAIGNDGTLYVGSTNDYLYAVNTDGSKKWQYYTSGDATSSPAIGNDGTIYVGSENNSLYAITPEGKLKWKYLTDAPVFSSPAIGIDGKIYVGINNKVLRAITLDGKSAWRMDSYYDFSSPSVGMDNIIYIGEGNSILSKDRDGSFNWNYYTDGAVTSTPAIGKNGTIYAGSNDKNIYALTREGELLWKYTTGGPVNSSPAINSGGTVFVGSNDGYLYAFQTDNGGLADTPWPCFHKDNKNLGNINYSEQYPVTACFSVSPKSGFFPLEVQFTDTSKGEITSWLWDFGDGANSNEQNPLHTYSEEGNFGVKLTVSNEEYTHSLYKDNYIKVYDSLKIIPDFTMDIEEGPAPLNVKFSDTSIGIPTIWKWVFGDGDTSTIQNPEHIFEHPGSYLVMLIVSNEYQTDSIVREIVTTEKWKIQSSESFACPAIGDDNTIYIGNYNKYFYAISPEGTVKWRRAMDWGVARAAAIGTDSTIYVDDGYHRIKALSPDGSLKWDYDLHAHINASPVIGNDGTIFVSCDEQCFYAFSPDGSLKWKFQTEKSFSSSPAVSGDNTVYIGNLDHNLYAISSDGTLKWKYLTEGWIYSSPAIGCDGTLYFGSQDKYLYAISPDGALKWKIYLGRITSSPVIGSDGTIYIGSENDKLYAITPDGEQKWEFSAGSNIVSTPAVGKDGTIYFGSWDKYFYALSPDGSLKWKYLTGGYVGSPAIGKDGTVYVGSTDRKFYAFSTFNGGLANSPWPCFLQNPKNTGYLDITSLHLPASDFSSNTSEGGLPLQVQFIDNSTGDISGWLWDFGDGESSVEQNPVHTYMAEGTYTVSLAITGSGSSDIEVKNGFINVITVNVNLFGISSTITISPNPTTGILYIKGLPSGRGIDISIYNIMGQQIKNVRSFGSFESFDISNFERGIYFIQFNNNPKNTIKILKE
ncbi:MAG: PQQ-binding-like beta-propeller repeat protein [Prolixibacteraceae bacterium]|nr:PQQ-binding-like beta-propeller repeat protein [Prolixibacteraceae bacterium]